MVEHGDGLLDAGPETAKVPRALTVAEVKQLFADVIKMQREKAERRRRLGIPEPEAPGFGSEVRDSLYRGMEGVIDNA